MKYHVISIGSPEREANVLDIHSKMTGHELAGILSFNAYKNDPVDYLEYHGIRLRPDLWTPKVGELGIWCSILNCWKWCAETGEPLLVFEDDAILVDNFTDLFQNYMSAIPKDWEFSAIWVPDNQKSDYFYPVIYDEHGVPHHQPKYLVVPAGRESVHDIDCFPVTLAYQGYGGVAVMFSPLGSQKMIDISQKMGVYTPIDCHFYLSSHRPVDNIKGYAPHPSYEMVKYNWDNPSTVQQSERVNI